MIVGLFALLSAQDSRLHDGIPSVYQGVWDASPAFCNEPVSDMRLGISSEEFTIYRDQFRVHRITRNADGSLVVKVSYRSHDDFDNEGFGKPYDLVWTLSQSGNDLTMTSSRGPTTWHRCLKKNGE